MAQAQISPGPRPDPWAMVGIEALDQYMGTLQQLQTQKRSRQVTSRILNVLAAGGGPKDIAADLLQYEQNLRAPQGLIQNLLGVFDPNRPAPGVVSPVEEMILGQLTQRAIPSQAEEARTAYWSRPTPSAYETEVGKRKAAQEYQQKPTYTEKTAAEKSIDEQILGPIMRLPGASEEDPFDLTARKAVTDWQPSDAEFAQIAEAIQAWAAQQAQFSTATAEQLEELAWSRIEAQYPNLMKESRKQVSTGSILRTATNRKTGEKVGWDGSAWQPIP